MNAAFVAVLEKMHQALAHLQDVIPAAAGIKGVLASIRADLDAMAPPAEKDPEPEGAAKQSKASKDDARDDAEDNPQAASKTKTSPAAAAAAAAAARG